MRLHREKTTFYIRLIAYSAEVSGCVQDSLPFRLEVPLNIVNLTEGPYEINVNGVTAQFDTTQEPTTSSSLEDFTNNLLVALTQRD